MFGVRTVFLINSFQSVQKAHSSGSIIAGGFREQHAGDDGVFISRVRAFQVAEAFFKAKYERMLISAFVFFNLFSDEFKAGQHFDQGDVIILGNGAGELC